MRGIAEPSRAELGERGAWAYDGRKGPVDAVGWHVKNRELMPKT